MKNIFSAAFRKSLSVLLLISLLLALVSCQKDVPDSSAGSEPSETSSDAGQGSASDESSETSADVTTQRYKTVSITSDQIPAARDGLETKQISDSVSVSLVQFLGNYDGTFPVISDVICTETECFACVIYSAVRSEDEAVYSVVYDWLAVDFGEGCLKAGVTEVPDPFVYEKNENNTNRFFKIEYDRAESGTACPYAVLYCENGQEKAILCEESADCYAKIIRQNDLYAVLSLLKGTERSYLLLDSEGNIISKLDWVSDISVISPLMFGEGLLYCKTDSDEDYVYDTIGAIDLQTGEYSDIVSVGNAEYWTYFADGSGIAVYGGDNRDESAFGYFSAADGKVRSVSVGQPITSLEVADGVVYGVAQGEDFLVFAWDAVSEELYVTDPFSVESQVAFGNEVFAVLENGELTAYICNTEH